MQIVFDSSMLRWKDGEKEEGIKWNYLEHKGPYFAPDYEPLPDDVKFYYNGREMKLEPETEEVAVFYGKMLDHDYTTKEVFNRNFFKDWRQVSLMFTHKETLRGHCRHLHSPKCLELMVGWYSMCFIR